MTKEELIERAEKHAVRASQLANDEVSRSNGWGIYLEYHARAAQALCAVAALKDDVNP
jgi:hypothetical protein